VLDCFVPLVIYSARHAAFNFHLPWTYRVRVLHVRLELHSFSCVFEQSFLIRFRSCESPTFVRPSAVVMSHSLFPRSASASPLLCSLLWHVGRMRQRPTACQTIHCSGSGGGGSFVDVARVFAGLAVSQCRRSEATCRSFVVPSSSFSWRTKRFCTRLCVRGCMVSAVVPLLSAR